MDGSLRELYGERHRGLVLYGSHARGEADDGSDVDLLLLLEGQVEIGKEIRRSSDLVATLSLESGLVLSLIPVSIEDYEASSDPYLINARREGALLSPTAG
ncbi:MAG: nucleotidyltransferase domain-containing protein [Rubrobacter sp.]